MKKGHPETQVNSGSERVWTGRKYEDASEDEGSLGGEGKKQQQWAEE